MDVAGGEAIYYDRGCLWRGPASDGRILMSALHPPLLGRPALGRPSGFEVQSLARWVPDPTLLPHLESLDRVHWRWPELLRDLWRDRLAVQPVRAPAEPRDPMLLDLAETIGNSLPWQGAEVVDTASGLSGQPRSSAVLFDRTLYDLVLQTPGGESFQISPHALYLKDSWDSFGIIHATDLHVSRRTEDFAAKLGLQPVRQAGDEASTFVNYNDGLRDLIRYANHLHARGRHQRLQHHREDGRRHQPERAGHGGVHVCGLVAHLASGSTLGRFRIATTVCVLDDAICANR